MNYTEGRQPCDRFDPAMSGNEYAVWPNVHSCYGPYDDRGKVPDGSCEGRVSFCVGCRSDHHSGGWDTCGTAQRIDLDALPYTGYEIGGDPLVRLSDIRRALGVEPSQMPCVVDGSHSDDLAHAYSVEAGTHEPRRDSA